MFAVTEYSVELVKDPFRILAGKRYEFIIDLDIDEEDEIYSDKGIYIKAIYKIDEDQGSIVSYSLIEKTTERHVDFDLEDDEEAELAAFCLEHYQEAEE